jgi:magnesium-protoporphyrin O-methyltransferase
MDCCCSSLEAEFGARHVTAKLRQYRRQGPARTTRLLVEALLAAGVEGRTVLDIGGGVGAVQHELLRAGAARANGVDASRAAIEAVRAEAERQGHADRLSALHGDFVTLAPTIPPADIVTLDRVICCYPDMPALVGLSAARAGALYGLVYPRDQWWVKAGLALTNLFFRARRKPFRVFAHPTPAIEAVAREHGLHPRASRTTFIWRVVVFGREGA